MDEQTYISLSEAAKMCGLRPTLKPEQFEKLTGLKPVQQIKTGRYTFSMFDPQAVHKYVDSKKPKSLPQKINDELERDITLVIAATNAQATRIEKLERNVNFLGEKMQTMTEQIETLTNLVRTLVNELGGTKG